ncbi:hypothetical protein NDA01_24250 [Trichocoleus desertorum AS-A10]|uniref:hypothetical protein n=1 Tax=Trichocoleus desertorum TaxID=1481672 RepID=UPI003296C5E8
MRYISAEDWELLSFFEVEPQRLDPSVPWVYDDSVYLVEDGELSLSCAIHPVYKDVRIILKHRGHCLYEFEAMGVKDIQVLKEKGSEILEITLSEQQNLQVKLRPSIQIVHRHREETTT